MELVTLKECFEYQTPLQEYLTHRDFSHFQQQGMINFDKNLYKFLEVKVEVGRQVFDLNLQILKLDFLVVDIQQLMQVS